jgi:hypothetical protein
VNKEIVFVSHPYADNPVENKKKADKICRELVKQGYIPISPLHLFSFYDDDADREYIMSICYGLIDMCHRLFSYGKSPGCIDEYNYALRTGKPIKVMV